MTPKDDAALDRLLNQWAAAPHAAPLAERTSRQIETTLEASLAPVRPLPPQPKLALRFWAVFAACSLVLIALLDKAGFHLMTGWQMTWMAAIFAAGALLFSWALAAGMVPGSRLRVSPALAVAGGAAGIVAGFALLFPWRTAAGFVPEGRPCALLELMIALPASGIFWLLARRGALVASAALGAALSGLAIFLALAPLQFQCMFPNAPHLLVWHAGTAILLVGLGACAGRIWEHRKLL